ncbi:response regulator [Nitrospira sp. Ecomares 2.1]
MIMIITPDETFRKAMVLHFQEKKYELSIPEHRQDVPSLVEKHAPDVIVLDMSIADPNGPTILKDLRGTGYTGKIVVISGPSNRPLMVDIHHQKVDQVMRKSPTDPLPSLMDQLESIIRVMFREEISKKAYDHYNKRFGQHGKDWEDWFKAEKEILKNPTGGRAPLNGPQKP